MGFGELQRCATMANEQETSKGRPISPQELAVVRWLLDHAATGDVFALNVGALEEARVTPGCTCGCTSVDFVQGGPRDESFIAADAFAVWPDGERAGVMLWARRDQITGIEVYDLDPDTSRRVITPELLQKADWTQPPPSGK